jgi:hypothetical protein
VQFRRGSITPKRMTASPCKGIDFHGTGAIRKFRQSRDASTDSFSGLWNCALAAFSVQTPRPEYR